MPIKKKPIKKRELTIKQRKFIDEVVKSGNATDAAVKAGYKHKTRHVAESVGSENMSKPEIKAEIEDRLKIAKDMIYIIATTAENEAVRLKASQDIVDRNEGKAVSRVEHSGKMEMEVSDISKMTEQDRITYLKSKIGNGITKNK